MIRRVHYSTALAQSQVIFTETLTLFELWQPGMSTAELFEYVRKTNALEIDSERRLRNILYEGFGSRYLRLDQVNAALALKNLFTESSDTQLLRQINLLYTARQHGILFDFIANEYWPAVATLRREISKTDVLRLIDRGRIEGKLEKDWSESVRQRVSSYVLGAAADLGLLGKPSKGQRPVQQWRPLDKLLIYLAYDLHFLGFSDGEIADSDHWRLLGLARADLPEFFNRTQASGHWIAQDTGHLMRIEWKLKDRKDLIDVINR